MHDKGVCPSRYRIRPEEWKELGARVKKGSESRRLPEAVYLGSEEYQFLRSGVDYKGPRPCLYVEYMSKTSGELLSAVIEHVGVRSFLLLVEPDGTMDLSNRIVI